MDILQDRGFIRLLQVKTANPELIPDYVNEADLTEIKTAAAALSDTEFGDDGRREYPLGDKAQIWLSAMYFSKNAGATQPGANSEYVWERIKFAADVYGISDEVENLRKRLAPVKAAAAEEHWGWDEGGSRRYPLHTADLVKKAMPYFERNRDKYPFAMRRKLASAIHCRALGLGIEPTEIVRKEAGVGYPDRAAVVDSIEDRCRRLAGPNPELAQKLAAYAEVVKTAETDELLQAVDAAVEAVEAADKTAGFKYSGKDYSGKLVERPVDAFFSISPAKAAADTTLMLADAAFDCEKLAELVSVPDFDAALGQGFLKQALAGVKDLDRKTDAQALFEVLSGLSDTDKRVLERHLRTI